jgi:hypothetical protein
MAKSPAFELFEGLCSELAARPEQTITEDDLTPGLIEDLKRHFAQTESARAYLQALESLKDHFEERSAGLPFEVDLEKREFRATDLDYIEFVAFARASRSVSGQVAKEFETRILDRLRLRVTGDLRCVGAPRATKSRKKDFQEYLESLGFSKSCLDPRDKDGGLDILWSLPIGAVPLQPIVSVQCKNSYFDEDEANRSVGRAKATMRRHSHLVADHLSVVVFNDYIDSVEFVGRAVGWSFVPLGITDLASATSTGVVEVL